MESLHYHSINHANVLQGEVPFRFPLHALCTQSSYVTLHHISGNPDKGKRLFIICVINHMYQIAFVLSLYLWPFVAYICHFHSCRLFAFPNTLPTVCNKREAKRDGGREHLFESQSEDEAQLCCRAASVEEAEASWQVFCH